jgi:hypothetical protein
MSMASAPHVCPTVITARRTTPQSIWRPWIILPSEEQIAAER